MEGDEGENYSEIEIYLARNEYHDAGSNRGRERIYSEAINEVSHGGRASYFISLKKDSICLNQLYELYQY